MKILYDFSRETPYENTNNTRFSVEEICQRLLCIIFYPQLFFTCS